MRNPFTLYRDAVSVQGKGAWIIVQVRYTVLMIGRSRPDHVRPFCLEIDSPRHAFYVTPMRWNPAPADRLMLRQERANGGKA